MEKNRPIEKNVFTKMTSERNSTKSIMKNVFEDAVFFVVDYPWNYPTGK